MANSLFPSTLNRKQYLIRFLIVVIIVAAAFMSFVAAPEGWPVQTSGIVFPIVALVAFFYHLFAMAIPRLKSAQISLLALLLIFVPLGILVLVGICAFAPEKLTPAVTKADLGQQMTE